MVLTCKLRLISTARLLASAHVPVLEPILCSLVFSGEDTGIGDLEVSAGPQRASPSTYENVQPLELGIALLDKGSHTRKARHVNVPYFRCDLAIGSPCDIPCGVLTCLDVSHRQDQFCRVALC
jgi:hypothetical protein